MNGDSGILPNVFVYGRRSDLHAFCIKKVYEYRLLFPVGYPNMFNVIIMQRGRGLGGIRR